MAKVTVYFQRRRLTEVELKRKQVRVGRHSAAEVFLPQQSVSRLHAVLVHAGSRWEVHDPGGTNGLFVNWHRVSGSQSLVSGDRIQLGGYTLVFDSEELDTQDILDHLAGAGAEDGPRPRNWAPVPDGTERFDATQELSMIQAQAQRMKTRVREGPHLEWVSAGRDRTVVPLGEDAVTVGSDAHCRITIEHGIFVRGIHAAIYPRGEDHVLERAAWWARVYLNRRPAKRRVVLEDGDLIEIKRDRIVFYGPLFDEDEDS